MERCGKAKILVGLKGEAVEVVDAVEAFGNTGTYRKLTKFMTDSLGVRAIGVFRFGYLPGTCVFSC